MRKKQDDVYFFIKDTSEIYAAIETNSSTDMMRYACNNYFDTRNDARNSDLMKLYEQNKITKLKKELIEICQQCNDKDLNDKCKQKIKEIYHMTYKEELWNYT